MQKVNFMSSVLYLASIHSPRYKGTLARKILKAGIDVADDSNDPRIVRRLRCEALAETVLLGWEGIRLRGRELPYSTENAVTALMANDRLYHFVQQYEGVAAQSRQGLIERLRHAVDWQIRWAQNLSMLYEVWQQTGKIPPALQNRPDLTPDLSFYLDAYSFLASFRSPGFSDIGPLAYDSLVQYAQLAGYTEADDIQFFCEAMLACDHAAREAFKAIKPAPKSK